MRTSKGDNTFILEAKRNFCVLNTLYELQLHHLYQNYLHQHQCYANIDKKDYRKAGQTNKACQHWLFICSVNYNMRS